ncbi:MAG: hypothetical protein MUE87_04050 [Methanothrix sp.]|nr:hypothetical protein [Methanothrix sp.]
MRSVCLCLYLLILATGQAGAIDQQFPPYESVDMISSSFGQSFVESLFGTGVASTDMSEQWFGPIFQNRTSAYSFLSEFYINTSMPMAGGLAPARIDVSQRLPAKIYFGSGQEILYTQYQTAMSASRGNELWIVKYQDWSQYAIVPLGIGLQFIAFAPAGGQADYYEILQTDNQNLTSRKVNLYAGYTSLSFPADSVGRHIIFYVLNNQPSNAIIIDVINPPQASPAVQMPETSDMPPAFGQMGAISGGPIQTTTMSIAQTTTTAIAGPSAVASQPAQIAPSGDTPVTIRSQGMRGYQIYLDGALIGTEGSGGDAPDGQFSFSVTGGQEHNIRVFDGQFNYDKGMIYFQRGVLKIINVEPGTAVYI